MGWLADSIRLVLNDPPPSHVPYHNPHVDIPIPKCPQGAVRWELVLKPEYDMRGDPHAVMPARPYHREVCPFIVLFGCFGRVGCMHGDVCRCGRRLVSQAGRCLICLFKPRSGPHTSTTTPPRQVEAPTNPNRLIAQADVEGCAHLAHFVRRRVAEHEDEDLRDAQALLVVWPGLRAPGAYKLTCGCVYFCGRIRERGKGWLRGSFLSVRPSVDVHTRHTYIHTPLTDLLPLPLPLPHSGITPHGFGGRAVFMSDGAMLAGRPVWSPMWFHHEAFHVMEHIFPEAHFSEASQVGAWGCGDRGGRWGWWWYDRGWGRGRSVGRAGMRWVVPHLTPCLFSLLTPTALRPPRLPPRPVALPLRRILRVGLLLQYVNMSMAMQPTTWPVLWE